MNTSDIINIVLASFAGAAVVVSIVALVQSSRANRKADRNSEQANEIQAQLLEIEKQRETAKVLQQRRANVAVTLEPYFDSSGRENWRLKLVNMGNAEARNIQVTLDGKSVYENDHIITNEDTAEIVLGAGNSFSWPVMVSRDYSPCGQAVVTWEDESGQPGQYRTTLSL